MARYLAGECTEREEAELRARLITDEGACRLFEELRRVWNASDGASENQLSDDDSWALLRRRLQQDDGHGRAPSKEISTASEEISPSPELKRVPEPKRHAPGPVRSRRNGRARARRTRRWGVAAVLAVVVLAGVLATLFIERSPWGRMATSARVITAEKGQRLLVRLADGTQVTLGAGSWLTLPAGGFAADRRAVQLEGQAYFEVAPDSTRPFVVYAKRAAVRVLGTTFVIEAFPDRPSMAVAVTEGRVALASSRPGGPDTATVLLEPSQVGIVSASGDPLSIRRGVDLTPYLAWTEGRLVFNDASFEKVMRRLERWYDLHVDVRVPVGRIDRLDATFEGVPVGQVLQAIAAALDLQYTKDRQTVTFYRQRPGPSVHITK